MLPVNPLLNATAPAGPHLPVALLRQYAAGTLAPAAQHRVEAHTLACTRCADILAGLLQTPPTTTDQALAQLQQRLRQRVQQQAAPARLAPQLRRHRWLAPQLAAAATLLLGLVAGGWWTWQQRHLAPATVATAARPAASAGNEALRPPAVPAGPAPASRTAPVATSRPAPRQHPTVPGQLPQHPLAKLAPKTATAAKPAAVAVEPAAAAPAYATSRAGSPAATSRLAAPVASSPAPAQADSTKLMERVAGVAVSNNYDQATKVRASAMPAAPGLPPTPVGGYAAWREQLRHEATEFKPEPPEPPLSGTVQLGVTIGADGKIQEIKVLRGLRADYDAEAQRLVCEGPKWVPGIGGGQRAARTVLVAVPF